MEELLKKIETFNKIDSVTEVEGKIILLKEYLVFLEKVSKKIDELKNQYKKDIEDILVRKDSEEIKFHQKIEELKLKEKKLAQIVTSIEKEIDEKKHEIESSEITIKRLENISRDLLISKDNLDDSNERLRNELSKLNLSVNSLKENERKLETSIKNKENELSTISSEIEKKSKEFSRIKNDIAILEARKK